jgi:hypothetical protein
MLLVGYGEDPGVIEVKWPLLPQFMSMDAGLLLKVKKALSDELLYEMATPELLHKASTIVAHEVVKHYPNIQNLDQVLNHIQKMEIAE